MLVLPHPALTQPRPCCCSTATALCQLLREPLPTHRNRGGPKAQGIHYGTGPAQSHPQPQQWWSCQEPTAPRRDRLLYITECL